MVLSEYGKEAGKLGAQQTIIRRHVSTEYDLKFLQKSLLRKNISGFILKARSRWSKHWKKMDLFEKKPFFFLLWRRANARNISQHTLYGVQHIHINLTLIHCMSYLLYNVCLTDTNTTWLEKKRISTLNLWISVMIISFPCCSFCCLMWSCMYCTLSWFPRRFTYRIHRKY